MVKYKDFYISVTQMSCEGYSYLMAYIKSSFIVTIQWTDPWGKLQTPVLSHAHSLTRESLFL